MNVSVFGLGYVGAVSCGCFANDGMHVVGVDTNDDKVALVNDGRSPIIEPEIGDLIATAVQEGRLRATTDAAEAVRATDISVISVGTPSRPNGSLSLDAVASVCADIGRPLAAKADRHLVVVRSTMLPGSVRDVVVPALEDASGKKVGRDIGVCFNPEFLREGQSVRDHYDPPFVAIGSWNAEDGLRAAELYRAVSGERHHGTVETIEMLKYVCNAFHALKTAFANEIGVLANACGVDGRTVMDLACRDHKLNISSRYLTPGFAFGGSCLPKDLRALSYQARVTDVSVPLLDSILPSNRLLIDRAFRTVLNLRKKKVALLGLSFKPGTDDLRESPLVQLAESLLGKGFDLRILDENVSMARLVGANRQYIEREIPHLSALLVPDLDAAIAHADVLIVGHKTASIEALVGHHREGQTVLDLAGIPALRDQEGLAYSALV